MKELATVLSELTPAYSFQLWERETRGEVVVAFFERECRVLIDHILKERLLFVSESLPRMDRLSEIPIQI